MILWRDLALFARFEREKNRVNFVCPAHQYFRRAGYDTFLEMEFRIRNSYSMDGM